MKKHMRILWAGLGCLTACVGMAATSKVIIDNGGGTKMVKVYMNYKESDGMFTVRTGTTTCPEMQCKTTYRDTSCYYVLKGQKAPPSQPPFRFDYGFDMMTDMTGVPRTVAEWSPKETMDIVCTEDPTNISNNSNIPAAYLNSIYVGGNKGDKLLSAWNGYSSAIGQCLQSLNNTPGTLTIRLDYEKGGRGDYISRYTCDLAQS